jgi:hypothetical protein
LLLSPDCAADRHATDFFDAISHFDAAIIDTPRRRFTPPFATLLPAALIFFIASRCRRFIFRWLIRWLIFAAFFFCRQFSSLFTLCRRFLQRFLSRC